MLRQELTKVSTDAPSNANVAVAQLRVFSRVFDAIIASDPSFGPVLRKVKGVYDACTAPWTQIKSTRQAQALARRPMGSAAADPGGAPHSGRDAVAAKLAERE